MHTFKETFLGKPAIVYSDVMVSKTGNIAVEVEKNEKPSGVYDIDVHWIGFLLGGEKFNSEECRYYKATRLRRYLEMAPKQYRTVDNRKLLLVPLVLLDKLSEEGACQK